MEVSDVESTYTYLQFNVFTVYINIVYVFLLSFFLEAVLPAVTTVVLIYTFF